MEKRDFTTSFTVKQSPEKVYEAINNVRGWWSENIEGQTDELNAEWIYGYKDVHVCKMKITEMIPNKKVEWLVLNNHFNFTQDENEWNGNTIIFEISSSGSETHLQFTQIGLVPEYECFTVCQDAWTSYIQGSLKSLIETGTGKPNSNEGGLNAELVEKYGLHKK